MIRLHRLLRDHPDAVEADLLRFWQVELFPDDGTGVRSFLDWWLIPRAWRPSTRRVLVLLRHIPRGRGSAVHAIRDRWDDWSIEAELIDFQRRTTHAIAAKGHEDPGPHPRHPSQRRTVTPQRQRALADARKRAADRKRRIEAGEIT